MKRSGIKRRTPLSRSQTPMRRGRVKPRRATPRRREAPRWDAEQWSGGRDAVLARAAWRCECCGEDLLYAGVEIHHRVRRRDGGDRLSNLLALIPEHHTRWTANPAEAIARGIIVPTHAEPDSVPVLWRGTSWSILTDDGTRLGAHLDSSYRITG